MVPSQTLNEFPHLSDLAGIQAHRRFIENNHWRIVNDCLGNPHPLSVSLGEFMYEILTPMEQTAAFHGEHCPFSKAA